jgi:gas vesicle protein
MLILKRFYPLNNTDWRSKMRERENEYSTRRSSGLTAFLIGGIVGGTIALLYAPQSGKKTREFLLTEGQDTADKVMRSIRDAQESVLATIEDAQVRMVAMNRDTKERLQRLQ